MKDLVLLIHPAALEEGLVCCGRQVAERLARRQFDSSCLVNNTYHS